MRARAALEPTLGETDRTGFFGKLPTHGDFVSAGLSLTVQNALDAWLQSSLQAVQHRCGKDWERVFQAMPGWRFIIERHLWGPVTVAGVILPSVDRVGRSFPFVVAAQIHAFNDDPRCLCLDDTWFTAAEAMVETSRQRDFDIDVFMSSLKRLRNLRPGEFSRNLAGDGTGSPGTFWWRVDPVDRHLIGFRTGGAPSPDNFLRLLDEKQQHLKQQPPSAPVQPAIVPKPQAAKPSERLHLLHSHADHPGTRLTINADSAFGLSERCIFAIADGIGDGSAALEASRLVTTMLNDAAPQETIEALTSELKGKLGRAHALLQSSNIASDSRGPAASVVVLSCVSEKFAVLWAGDARCYLVRDGMMRSLTRDHVEVGPKRTLARGLGTQGQLVPEVLIDTLQVGDRFMICSQPLLRVLSERTIAEILLATDLDDAPNILVQEALIANCRDNLSIMVVDVGLAGV